MNDFFILSKWSFKSPHKNISCQRKWSVSSSMTFSFSVITISFTSNVSKIWSRIFQHERSETFILMFSSPFNKISQRIWQKIRSCLGQSEVTLIMRKKKKKRWRRIPCLYSIFQSLFRDICHTIKSSTSPLAWRIQYCCIYLSNTQINKKCHFGLEDTTKSNEKWQLINCLISLLYWARMGSDHLPAQSHHAPPVPNVPSCPCERCAGGLLVSKLPCVLTEGYRPAHLPEPLPASMQEA